MKQARPSSDEAVRRIREESRRRIAERNRWRAFSSWCALATLASGISLTALGARDARRQRDEDDARQAAIAESIRVEETAARQAVEAGALRARDESVRPAPPHDHELLRSFE